MSRSKKISRRSGSSKLFTVHWKSPISRSKSTNRITTIL